MDCVDVLDFIKPGHIVCEIGCRTGLSTKLFLEAGAIVYTIDPWIEYMEYRERVNGNWYYQAMERLAPFGSKVIILRMMSNEAVPFIPMCDLIWIDGNHDYNFVLKDMEMYWDKVKSGGYLSGDDYHMEEHPDVKDAVNFFVEKNKLNLDILGRSWIIKKETNEY